MDLTQRQNITPLRIMVPIMAIYFALSLIGILSHEIWLDEAQHFLIARDSKSLTALFSNMKYDGHVQLWNYLLFFITHYISSTVLAMQLFHLVIVNIAVFVFLRFAPFSLLVKILVIAGYYFLFEYSLLSRNYALGILWLFILCSIIGKPDGKMIVVGLLCFLMCLTHLFFLFAAIGIMLYYLYNSFNEKKFPKQFAVFVSFTLAGILLAFLQMKQIPTDNTYFHPAFQLSDAKNPSYSIYGLARGFFPLQDIAKEQFWDSYLFDKFVWPVKIFIASIILVYPYFIFRKNKSVLLFYYATTGLLLCFLFTTHMVANRYYGMFFIYFLVALWLGGNEGGDVFEFKVGRGWLSKGFFYFILTTQVFAGIYAYTQDVSKPFSLAKSTAQYLKNRQFNDGTIVVDGYGGGPSISAYLGEPLFYLDINQPGSYCIWKKSFFHVPPLPLQQELATSVYIHTLDKFVLISTRAIAEHEVNDVSSNFQLTELVKFTNGIIRPDYYLYSVQRINR